MMQEISLNILDVVQNSITAKATLITIWVNQNINTGSLEITIKDNGLGMSTEQLHAVEDPFYTTRTTRKVGLGIPFFKMAATITGGEFHIQSKPMVGTSLYASFHTTHIDCMPLGDMISTIHTLVTTNETIDFLYTYEINNNSFTLDTREFREILGDIPFHTTEVSTFIKEYLTQNQTEIDSKFL